jgi:DNA (cytosine-5)-methyltransferase 1
MNAYYNEIDPYAAAWLRNLIAAGHIAPGVVDERSIEDVRPDDLRGFKQCHFFAGIGVWSLALRRAGWPDDRPVWTGSCPCQPFSAAGKGAGFADERHLWPAFHHLISERRPAVVLGEQVASSHVDAWIDLVHADLEAVGYAFGSVPFPSAGVGAPHIRDRNYWVAQPSGKRREWRQGAALGGFTHRADAGWVEGNDGPASSDEAGMRMADAERARICGGSGGIDSPQAGAGDREHLHDPVTGGHSGRLADAADQRQHGRGAGVQGDGRDTPRVESERLCDAGPAGPTNGWWRDADWLFCRDGKFRPVEPGTFPLVNGASARVGRLRAYGNSITAPAAQIFISSVMESIDAN